MRIDKFLWSVRVYKTRTLATEEIKKNRISIGEQVAKPSREVKPGEIIKIRKNQIDYKIKVLSLPKSRVGAKLVPKYIADRTEKDQYEILALRRSEQNYYRTKGEGRPTKKDRRDIDSYISSDEEVKNNIPDNSFSTDWEGFFSTLEDEVSEDD